MAAAVAENPLKAVFDREVAALRAIQADLSRAITTRGQCLSQFTETESVLEELRRLEDEANVYKLVGPVMVKQDPVEAKSNVGKRLDYIKKDIDKLDSQIKSLERKLQEKQGEVMKLQQRKA